jgi:hypothetical protein
MNKIETNEDLAEAALSKWPAALKSCNDDKKLIREFSDKK